MAVCGLLSMPCVSPIQPDMDSCPGQPSGVTRNHLKFWQSGVGPRASSCLSSTMVDHNDPDDSGSSQPPTPTRALSDSKLHSAIRGSPLPRHELDLSISLNDAQRSSTPPRSKSTVRDDFGFTSASGARDDILGLRRSLGRLEEDPPFTGPPQKRARMSSLGFRLDDNQAGNIQEQLQLQRPSLASSSSAITGVHSLMPSRSLPSFRSADREPSPSPSRGASSGSKPPTTSWWLGAGGSKNSAMIPSETQHLQSSAQEQLTRANFAIDGRGMIPGTSLQERDLPFKEPSFYPNMLSSMEASEQVHRDDLDAPPVDRTRAQDQAGRPQTPQDPPEHSFFSWKESSTSRLSSASTVSEETVPRPGAVFLGRHRESSFPDANALYGHHGQPYPSELQGGARRPGPTASESHQLVDLERDPRAQGSFARPQQAEVRALQPHGEQRAQPQGDQRASMGSPGGNANTRFFARILDAAQQPVSIPYSDARGFAAVGPFNQGSLGFNLSGQSLPPRVSSQGGSGSGPGLGSGPGPGQFGGGEGHNTNLVQANSEALRNLLAAQPTSLGSIPPFMSQVPNPDPARLSFPILTPGGASVAGSQGSVQQGYSFLGATTSQSLQQLGLPAELSQSFPPSGSQLGNLQPSQGLRDFWASQGGTKGPSSLGLERGPATGPHGFSSGGLESPTHLSLQAPLPLPPLPLPPLTVVMEGRSIGRRISLQDYDGYDSFAAAMRSMFYSQVSSQGVPPERETCTLATAIPGYVIAYEDEEGDVLLAGDLPWRDFVRVAKQIRIVSSSKISFMLPSVLQRL